MLLSYLQVERSDCMLDIFLKFFLGNYEFVVTDELISSVAPVLVIVAAALLLYMFICFFQFILKILHR